MLMDEIEFALVVLLVVSLVLVVWSFTDELKNR